jgi:hypothetical protein
VKEHDSPRLADSAGDRVKVGNWKPSFPQLQPQNAAFEPPSTAFTDLTALLAGTGPRQRGDWRRLRLAERVREWVPEHADLAAVAGANVC